MVLLHVTGLGLAIYLMQVQSCSEADTKLPRSVFSPLYAGVCQTVPVPDRQKEAQTASGTSSTSKAPRVTLDDGQ